MGYNDEQAKGRAGSNACWDTPITPIPEAPNDVKGIINLRGKIIPVIDMHIKFSREPKDYDDRTCIIIIDIQDTLAGLIVDRVSEVLTIEDGEIVPPPTLHAGSLSRYIKGYRQGRQ